MIYITGDVHGDLSRFKQGKLFWLGKKDVLIILGDFGFLWNGGPEEKKALEWLKKRRYTVLFLDGCNENYDLLHAYPVTEAFGGRVRHLGGSLYHICRGSVLQLDGKKLLCFGGGETTDKEEREEGLNWWPVEMPTDEEYAYCEQSLVACGRVVDYVLTHDAPSKLLAFTGLPAGEENRLHTFLDKVILSTKYKKWFFGRYHKDLTLSRKAACVFREVVALK